MRLGARMHAHAHACTHRASERDRVRASGGREKCCRSEIARARAGVLVLYALVLESHPLASARRRCVSLSAGKASKKAEGEFGPLLEQLKYGKVIKKISEIREMTKEDISKKFGDLALPRIVVIGNESSGKSSTLERIAGQPVLPVFD